MEELAHLDSADVNHLAAKLLAHWDWRSEPGGFGEPVDTMRPRSSSPESSTVSPCSSPEVQGHPGDMFVDFTYRSQERQATQSRSGRAKMSTKRRMKASEREKLRMRSLAEALHQLRDYLPPVYSRRGQPLTKIQTLKYTIEYIKELSDILSQE